MSQESFARVDPNLLEAFPIAFLLLGLCLEKIAERHIVNRVFAEVLSDHQAIADLTESQRLLVVQMCNKILDRVYSEQE